MMINFIKRRGVLHTPINNQIRKYNHTPRVRAYRIRPIIITTPVRAYRIRPIFQIRQ